MYLKNEHSEIFWTKIYEKRWFSTIKSSNTWRLVKSGISCQDFRKIEVFRVLSFHYDSLVASINFRRSEYKWHTIKLVRPSRSKNRVNFYFTLDDLMTRVSRAFNIDVRSSGAELEDVCGVISNISRGIKRFIRGFQYLFNECVSVCGRFDSIKRDDSRSRTRRCVLLNIFFERMHNRTGKYIGSKYKCIKESEKRRRSETN